MAESSEKKEHRVAARDLLDPDRIDSVAIIPDEAVHWDLVVCAQICEEYDIPGGLEILKRWVATTPSVRGKRSEQYVEAIKQGRETRERVVVARSKGLFRGGGGGDD